MGINTNYPKGEKGTPPQLAQGQRGITALDGPPYMLTIDSLMPEKRVLPADAATGCLGTRTSGVVRAAVLEPLVVW